MKTKTYILLFFILFSGVAFGQDAGFKTSTISHNFSAMQVEAYQESANKKIEDFYSYLNLLTDKNISQAVKNEIKESIYLLFVDRDVAIQGIVSKDNEKITLSAFLNSLEENSGMKYKIYKIENTAGNIYENYWLSVVSIEHNNIDIRHKVYFSPQQKQFGGTSKTVWEIKLGEIEIFE